MLHVGIDLHGTLITNYPEEVPARALPGLLSAMRELSGRVKLYACTGNDLSFLERKLPQQVMEFLDGAVLETGCVTSDLKTETVLVDEPTLSGVKELEKRLREVRPEWVYKFARRLTTVSMFTRLGLRPEDFLDEVTAEVTRLGFGELVRVTYSSVAVDIVPRGFTKLTGLCHLADGEPTVGIADSMNDLELVCGTDCSFLPANVSPELMRRLKDAGKRVQSINEASGLHAEIAILCSESFTDAVSQALRFLMDHLPACPAAR